MLGILLIGSAYAQDRRISGRVTAEVDGEPLSGVSVVVTGTTTGTATDESGVYSIVVPSGSQTLTFSFLGYTPQTVTVGSSNSINIALTLNASELTEVVVTALGIERQKKELGYAASTVSNRELTSANAVNVANGLQGKVSGLNVTTTSSGVFEDTKINLRGIRSMTGNNNPLLVIDGIPLDIRYLSSLNPNDIDDISVLKGSSSAAIYGPDARNGVILVTTKRGSEAPVITLGHSTQFQEVSFFPKLQKQFGQGYDGIVDPVENWSWGPAYDGSTVDIGPELPDGSQQTVTYSGTDERENVYVTGATFQTDASVSVKDFFLSLQDAKIKGIVPDDVNRRTGVRLNAGRDIGIVRAGLNVNYSQQNYNIFDQLGMEDYYAAQNIGGNDGLFNQLINTPAHVPLSKYKDYKNDPFSQYDYYYNNYGLNPYFSIGNWRKNGKRQDLITNLELSVKPLDWLGFTYRAGLVSQGITERRTSEGYTVSEFGINRGKTSVPGAVEERSYMRTRLSSELFGNVNKELSEDFRINGVLGTYVRQVDWRDTEVGAGTLVVPEIYNINNRLGNLTGSSPGYRTRLFSVYASAGLSFRGWANIEVTGRNDWTSVLAIGNNSYFYPGVSGALVLSDAIPALNSSSVISYLKLRGAWNKTGNADINPYLLAATFSQPDYTGFPFGNNSGLTAGNTAYDPNLKPEFINSTEAGLDISFFNNRVNLEATYFYQENTDQIISINLSDATGYGRSYLNAASFNNKGFELDLNLSPLVRFTDGAVRFRANATYNDSEVTSIFAEQELNQLSIGGYTTAGNFAVVGQPAFIIRATDYLRDDLGRIIVSPTSGRPSANSTLSDFGRTMPKWILGLNPSVEWKGFNLSALLEHKGGHFASFFAMGNDMAWTGVSAATAYNDREPFILPNSVVPNPAIDPAVIAADPTNSEYYIENTDARIGANEPIYAHYTGEFRRAASNFITSANTWRLRELALSYEFPQAWLQRQNVLKGLTVSLVGRNLFLWVPSENEFMDPDFNSMVEDYPNAFGNINATSNPPVRNYGFTVNARF